MGQGARLHRWRGQEEPGQDDRPGLQAAVQNQGLQAADRGGRGDRRPQPCQIRAQDDQLKLEENLPSWKLQPLNPICEDPEVGQTLSEILLCSPKTLIFSSNPIWFSGTLISVSSPTININH